MRYASAVVSGFGAANAWFGNSWSSTPSRTISTQKYSPRSSDWFTSWSVWTMMLTGVATFGSLLSGFLAQRFGAPRALAAGGVACLMGSMAFGFCLPVLKREARRLQVRQHLQERLEAQQGNK